MSTRDKLVELYLDYVNNFLTVKTFASYYGFGIAYAWRVIKVGRKLHEKRIS